MYTDLHFHLGSSFDVLATWEMAKERGIKMPYKTHHDFMDAYSLHDRIDHSEYLKKFDLIETIQSSTDAIEKSVIRSAAMAYTKCSVDLLEIRFNPMYRNVGGGLDLDAIITNACTGAIKAMQYYKMKIGIILCSAKRFDESLSLKIAEKAVTYSKYGVVGFDIAGYSNDDDLSHHYKAIEYVKAHGLGVTVHAGETNGYKEVLNLVKDIRIDRIGHGINIADDEETMRIVSDQAIALEVCPTSNYMTKSVSSYDELAKKLAVLYTHDIPITINTDGLTLLNTSIKAEYDRILDPMCKHISEIVHNPISTDIVDSMLQTYGRKYSFIKL